MFYLRRFWGGVWLALLTAAWPATRAAESPPPAAALPATSPGIYTLDFGLLLQAGSGSFKNVQGCVTVPADWPHQQRVRAVKQEAPPGATISYKSLDDVGRQMLVRIPALPQGPTRVVVTFEIEILPPPDLPQDTARFTAADPKKLPRKVALHLAPSPKIESDHPRVRRAAQDAVGQAAGAWQKVAAVHRWVAGNIAFAGGWENVQTCAETLDVRRGVCAEKNSLAVAMLRALDVPARLVRVPGHVYYEFYLLDGDGQGRWFSADATHSAALTPEGVQEGIILQKGDNVSAANSGGKRPARQRFLPETVTGTAVGGDAALQFQPITPAVPALLLDRRAE